MAMNRLQRIAIVGAGSKVGTTTLDYLLKINHDVAITIISREDSTATFPSSPRITVKKGSYDDPSFLHSAFEGHDLAMLIVSVWAAKEAQPKLIDAAAKAGVKWIMPNEYGPDNMNENMINLQKYINLPKNEVLQQIEEHAKIYPGLKWIGVATNPWTEMSLNYGLFGVYVPAHTLTLYSGAGPFNSSSEAQVGRGIASLLSLPLTSDSNPRASLSQYANNFVYISSFLLTQERLYESAKRVTGTTDDDWTVTNSSIEQRMKNAHHEMEKGNMMGGADLFYCHYMGKGLGGDYEAKAKEDRQALGLEEEDLDAVVRAALANAPAPWQA